MITKRKFADSTVYFKKTTDNIITVSMTYDKALNRTNGKLVDVGSSITIIGHIVPLPIQASSKFSFLFNGVYSVSTMVMEEITEHMRLLEEANQ